MFPSMLKGAVERQSRRSSRLGTSVVSHAAEPGTRDDAGTNHPEVAPMSSTQSPSAPATPRPAGGTHPAYQRVAESRAAKVQLRLADAITKFAGSMSFVYLHIVAFALWMLIAESSPWPTLTLVVSLEAIFLSTLVMIGQNRQAAYQQAKADHDFVEQELELKTNTEITRAIHTLTSELHRRLIPGEASDTPT
jgi:low affinity Fe/Cu permease